MLWNVFIREMMTMNENLFFVDIEYVLKMLASRKKYDLQKV